MTLPDETEIVHSELRPDMTVQVYIEKPDEKDGFHTVSCFLPRYEWRDNSGFSETEIKRYQEIVESTAHLILEFAETGGLLNASGF